MADQEQRNQKNGERPKEYEPRYKPPRVLDTWDRELLGIGVLVKPSLCQRAMPLSLCVHLLCCHGGRLAVVVLGETVCAVLEQLVYAFLAAFDEGPVQACEALVIGRIHVCAPSQEQIHAGRVALVCCPHERCMRLRIWNVDGYVLVEEKHDLVDIAVEGRRMEQVEALVVSEERVGAVVEQEVHDVVVAALRRP